jgi:uroporphyrinogen-III synthase
MAAGRPPACHLRVQLETSEEELEAMGWRTDWTEADTREELLEALRELGVLVGRLRRELVRHCRVAL